MCSWPSAGSLFDASGEMLFFGRLPCVKCTSKENTMALTLHQISLPVFIRHLNGLAGCMKKAQTLYAEKKYDETTLLCYRFYPDMFSFARQVQIATDHARNCTALLAGVEAPKYEDNEKSLADLIA